MSISCMLPIMELVLDGIGKPDFERWWAAAERWPRA